jgi:hypothetical protein
MHFWWEMSEQVRQPHTKEGLLTPEQHADELEELRNSQTLVEEDGAEVPAKEEPAVSAATPEAPVQEPAATETNEWEQKLKTAHKVYMRNHPCLKRGKAVFFYDSCAFHNLKKSIKGSGAHWRHRHENKSRRSMQVRALVVLHSGHHQILFILGPELDDMRQQLEQQLQQEIAEGPNLALGEL